MPHEVIMPALGMAQDTGQILAWHKKPGEAVSAGDVLFEVETDKAAMEVEASAPGYLTDVTAEAGSDVPVGQVIALICETPEGSGSASSRQDAKEVPAASDEPSEIEGREVIMPTLGMAQDTGLLVRWLKQPGEAVSADDVLFEVETDKSTVEVNAGHDGYIAALLAEAGEEVPVGQTIAVISAGKPEAPIARSAGPAALPSAPASVETPPAEEAALPVKAAPAPTAEFRSRGEPQTGGRILASPKARRLALERGLDLERLVEAGHAQPFHVKDLEALKALPPKAQAGVAAVPGRHLTAEIAEDGFTDFTAWAAGSAGLTDAGALLAGLAGASLGNLPVRVAVEGLGTRQVYTVSSTLLGQVSKAEPDPAPDLCVRDLRFSRIGAVRLGAGDCPALSITRAASGLCLTLECTGDHLSADAAVSLLSNFAGRMEQPLRHLL
ncbi:pyruvate dehydrogenase [Rhizobiales bacterium]|uniref:biotin/lipoyl-containing protein n=1 Tax=Hongsoonwoonella zoysiae TaxID=2821844 RepID=UPI0015604A6E|nr:biotin/lipoyl-containing protein [Hongsoonwoonella zoysiae]NRG17739.1 pyruvate dehydrogenase [Hongsoonwoonella zoysiae]